MKLNTNLFKKKKSTKDNVCLMYKAAMEMHRNPLPEHNREARTLNEIIHNRSSPKKISLCVTKQ